jgi:hypothetical protein
MGVEAQVPECSLVFRDSFELADHVNSRVVMAAPRPKFIIARITLPGLVWACPPPPLLVGSSTAPHSPFCTGPRLIDGVAFCRVVCGWQTSARTVNLDVTETFFTLEVPGKFLLEKRLPYVLAHPGRAHRMLSCPLRSPGPIACCPVLSAPRVPSC